MKAFPLFLAGLVLFLGACKEDSNDDEPAATGSLSMIVVNAEDNPAPGASVGLFGSEEDALAFENAKSDLLATDSTGKVMFMDQNAGSYYVGVSVNGYATAVLENGQVQINEGSKDEAGAPVKANLVEIPTIKTSFGEIVLWLYSETPKHKENFLKLTNEGFYNGTTFHRIIDGFMIQGGDPNSKDSDPTNDGRGGPGYTLPAEINPELKHIKGALAAARLPDNVNPEKESSGSQFYIVENAAGTPQLDGNYTVFGRTLKGIEVVETIATQQKESETNRPLTDIKMTIEIVNMAPGELKERYDLESN